MSILIFFRAPVTPYCPIIIINGTCNKWGVVYELVCKLCSIGNVKYQGEADRPVHYRLQEHIGAASNPLFYPNNAMGQHYSECHHNCKPSLEVSILDIQPHTTKRKLSEALFIHKHKPKLSDKLELESIVKYITQCTNIYNFSVYTINFTLYIFT